MQAAYIAERRGAALRTLAGAVPAAADEEPYTGQECIGLSEAWRALYALMHHTVCDGESNSGLVMGEHGCGKSLLVTSVVRRLCAERVRAREPAPWCVTLSALLHPTDRSCLADLATQLMEQGALGARDIESIPRDEPVQEPDADADDERAEWDVQREADSASGSDSEDEEEAAPSAAPVVPEAVSSAILSTMASMLAHILALLGGQSASGPPLVVVLDQFEQFAQRPRQTLLYCLLDAVQAGSYAPGMMVLGLSSRVDAPDFLEKRVKSRFSHRIVHVHPPSLDQYTILARTALLAGADPTTSDGAAWHADVDALLQHDAFRAALQRLHGLTGDVRLLYQALTPPVAALAYSQPRLHPASFIDAMHVPRHDAMTSLLLDLPAPDMALLAAVRHLQLREREPFTFEMCFHELGHFVQKAQRDLTDRHAPLSVAGLDRLSDRAWMHRSFAHLLALEILLPEPARQSLALPSGVATRTGAVTSAYGTLPSASVVPAFLPVRAQVTPKAILDSITSSARTAPLSSMLVTWAASLGV